ncbi:Hypothetical protein KVN_LOCUS426 [uncultured virus]|nr:Hypothetical protein KVN_LOCUS426 [uncultured virus]
MINQGSSNRLIYDNCAYEKDLHESTSPLMYNLYQGKFEHCQKCRFDQFITPYMLVDIESELRNQTRPQSNCDQFKYNPKCPKSRLCRNTFDKTNPIVLPPEVCPIVYNNIPRPMSTGYRLPNPNFC